MVLFFFAYLAFFNRVFFNILYVFNFLRYYYDSFIIFFMFYIDELFIKKYLF
jgi:hypothetical protein